MLTLILQLMLKYKSVDLSNHHHPDSFPHRHHQQQRHEICQSYYTTLSWFRQSVLSQRIADFAISTAETRLASLTRPNNVAGISHSVCIQKCCKVFFLAIILMALGCDAQEYSTSNRVGFINDSQRITGEAESYPPDSSKKAPFNFTNIMASTNSRASSAFAFPQDHVVPRQKKDGSVLQESAKKADLIAVLISTLEKLSVLHGSGSSCFRLEKIVQNVIETSSSSPSLSVTGNPDALSGSKTLGVYLYFKEVNIAFVNNSGIQQSHVTVNTSTNNSTVSLLKNSCFGDTVPEIHWKSVPQEVSGGDFYRPDVMADPDNSTNSVDVNGILHAGRFSRTQIVVISTCSSIIGMFFLVAAFLRIRNYIKRARMEQEMANRPKFRSCSVALRGATQSMEQLRRDSLVSKISHQNSDMTRGSNGSHTITSSRENSSPSSPRHDPDNAPLLLFTKAPEPSNPTTPTELTYIDEEDGVPKKKVTSPTSAGNSDCRLDLHRQDSSEMVLVDSCRSQNGGCNTVSCNTVLKKSSTPNEQSVSTLREQYVNPSFSIGSISSYAMNGSENQALDTPEKISTYFNAIQIFPGDLSSVLPSRTEQDTSFLGDKKCNRDLEDIEVQENLQMEIPRGQVTDVKTNRGLILEKQNAEKETSFRDRSPVAFLQTTSSSQQQNVSDKIQEQITCRNPACKINTETGDKMPLLSDISYFEQSQSDISMSSATNQGNEFFGQTEYKQPHERNDFCMTCNCETNITDSKYDTEKEVEDCPRNIIQQNVKAVYNTHTRSSSSISYSEEDVVRTKKKVADNLSKSGVQMLVNQVMDSSKTVEQSHCDSSIRQEQFPENLAFIKSTSSNFSTYSPKVDITNKTALADVAVITLTTQAKTPVNIYGEVQSPVASGLASRVNLLDGNINQSFPNAINNEDSTERSVLSIKESVNCKTSSEFLPESPSHVMVPNCDQIFCQQAPQTTDLKNQCWPVKENMVTSIELSLPDRDNEQKDTNFFQSHDLNNPSSCYVLPQQSNDISSPGVQGICHVNITPETQVPSMNNDPCLQLLPMQPHSQLMNSSTC